jgi:hypothetical protein
MEVCLVHMAEVGLADTRTILDVTMKSCHWKRNLRCPVPDILMSDYGLVCLNINKTTKIFLTLKPTRSTNYSNLFLEWNSTCFRQFLCPSSGVLHCTHSNGICYIGLLTACKQEHWYMLYRFADSLWAGANAPAHKLSAYLYDINHSCAYSEKLLMMDRGTVWNM